MQPVIDSTTLHRTAKYFMDNGRAETHDDAMALLKRFGLTIHVGHEIADSGHQQTALLTLVNVARRTLLGGVEIVGLPDAPSRCPLMPKGSLKQAVHGLGGCSVPEARRAWPSAVIGDSTVPTTKLPCWRLTWGGWRGGAIPVRDGRRLRESDAIALAPIVAAAACAAEVFAYHAGDHVMAGRRASGLSLWRPGADWLEGDATESVPAFLPSRLWLIGLGNLGQAFAWALASLPYQDRGEVKLILQDFDRMAVSNESTSLLSFTADIERRKARVVAEWMEARGFDAYVNERRFGVWTKRGEDEPGAAICGVDNALARAALGKPGFGLVVEAGLGAGPEAFRSISVHTFPSSRPPEEIWSRQVGQADENVENMPAYQSLKRKGMDTCGLARLASRTVGVPFVGLIAACLVVSELLRRLNGGCAFELMSGSVAALGDIETCSQSLMLSVTFRRRSVTRRRLDKWNQRKRARLPAWRKAFPGMGRETRWGRTGAALGSLRAGLQPSLMQYVRMTWNRQNLKGWTTSGQRNIIVLECCKVEDSGYGIPHLGARIVSLSISGSERTWCDPSGSGRLRPGWPWWSPRGLRRCSRISR